MGIKELGMELDSLLTERAEINNDLALAKNAGRLTVALHLRESLCHYDRWIRDKRDEIAQLEAVVEERVADAMDALRPFPLVQQPGLHLP
ncbi:hypothetical protein [Massilia glaciei]|uniref:Uncharacterized protein n=1 Tax=Massilia glaciei TaxID=1524097 RepID=A0A2U2HDK9_9BURK|nr:hypothetical protein [Massilia glaciei]PWF41211.1 hypothetical protein C7C56_025150 [Massilia glaciei]